MSHKIVRKVTYELDDNKVIKLEKWSIGKFYAMLDSISAVLQKVDIEFGKNSYSSQEIGQVLAHASQAASSQLTHIILESLSKDQNITEEDINNWMPEDYIGVLSKILKMNLTSQLVKNLKSLRIAFQPPETQ